MCCVSRISTVGVITLCTTIVITLSTVWVSGFGDDVSSTLCTLLFLLSWSAWLLPYHRRHAGKLLLLTLLILMLSR